jgi:phosphoadenosine phosphosulfate reductase
VFYARSFGAELPIAAEAIEGRFKTKARRKTRKMSYLTPNEELERLSPEAIIERVLVEAGDAPCITCSFQAGGMVVLDMLRKRVPEIPVLFVDTGYHFAATYAFRDRIAETWNLNLVNVTPKQSVAEQESAFGILNQADPDRCCRLRKVEPLFDALAPYDTWFTGLRRGQSATRRGITVVEDHTLPNGKSLLKVNPIAAWTENQVWRYTIEKGIEYLPLYNDGYTSIGCEPCTSLPVPGGDARSGRWGGKKTECGIHIVTAPAEERAWC